MMAVAGIKKRAASPSVNNDVVIQEGDSNTASGSIGYATKWGSENPTFDRTNLAVSGSGIIQLNSRQADALAYNAEVLSVLIGGNDLSNTTNYPTTQDWIDALFAYFAPFRAAGTKVVACTVLPDAFDAVQNSRRVTVNAALKAAMGTEFDALADFDATIMGDDATASDTTYFSDGIHMTDAGHNIILPNYSGAMRAALGLPKQVVIEAFTPVTEAEAGSTVTSAPVRVGGLNYGETEDFTVTGGSVSVNGGALVTSGTLGNGDLIEAEGDASLDPGGETGVTVAAGSTSVTFTIQTEGGAAPEADLTVEYLLDEGSGQVINDSGVNGLHGTLGNTSDVEANEPTWGAYGPNISGTGTLGCRVPANAALVGANVAVVAIVRVSSFAAQRAIVAQDTGTGRRFQFRFSTAAKLQTQIRNSAGTVVGSLEAAGATSLNDWTMVSFYVNGTTHKLRQDGVEVGSTTLSGAMQTGSGQELCLMGRWSGTSVNQDPMRGDMAYMALYNGATDDTGIAEMEARANYYALQKGITV